MLTISGEGAKMAPEDFGKQLHDRATRGVSLTAEEQKKLDAWYADQDQAEMEELNLSSAFEPEASLQSEVDSTLRRIAAVTRSIQEIFAENKALREEITVYRRKLDQQSMAQAI